MNTRNAIAACAALFFTCATAGAQTLLENKTLDNWYVSLHGGVDAQATHTKVFGHLNPLAGLRVGRWMTPVFGWAIEGDAYFENKQAHAYGLCAGTAVTSMNWSVLGTTNIGNWIWGYRGEPRTWEVSLVYGVGWSHVFGTSTFRNVLEAGDYRRDYLTWKMGVDVGYVFGPRKEWQVYVEPSLLYRVSGNGQEGDWTGLNLNRATVRLTAGIVYRLPNSDGSRHFRLAPLRNQQELDRLNEQVNLLRMDNEAKDRLLADKNGQIAEQGALLAEHDTLIPQQAERIEQLQRDLLEARSRPTEIVMDMHGTNMQPSVLFRLGSASIDNAQAPAIERIANYMKRNPEAIIEIRGYASPDENPERADELSLQRAEAVKKSLTKRYRIDAERLSVVSMGASHGVFGDEEFNRIVTFNDNSR